MKFDDVAKILDGIPYVNVENGRNLYENILELRPKRILELGHAKGVSTVYMAAALDEIGAGEIHTVDLLSAKDQEPNLEDLMGQAGVSEYINIYREKHSYTWFLAEKIQEQTVNGSCVPLYDFCYYDGSYNYTVAGFSFFLVDKLLKPGSWFAANGYDWRYQNRIVKGKKNYDGLSLRDLSEAELETPPMPLVFDILIKQKPEYKNFRLHNGKFAWIQKTEV